LTALIADEQQYHHRLSMSSTGWASRSRLYRRLAELPHFIRERARLAGRHWPQRKAGRTDDDAIAADPAVAGALRGASALVEAGLTAPPAE
jgi:hypothetical protein